MSTVLISVFCPDRPGLVALITGRLFDLGANLGDSSFAMLGAGGKFTSICDLPPHTPLDEVEQELSAMPELAGAEISVRPFGLDSSHGEAGRITHRIIVSGGDRPGLVARLSEAFGQYQANIVRMDAQRIPEKNLYVTRFYVSVGDRAQACLATVGNIAGELHLDCHVEQI